METSQEGKILIKAWEKTVLKPYKDEAGWWTIAIGHKMTFRRTGIIQRRNY